jgi:hypothetical protein
MFFKYPAGAGIKHAAFSRNSPGMLQKISGERLCQSPVHLLEKQGRLLRCAVDSEPFVRGAGTSRSLTGEKLKKRDEMKRGCSQVKNNCGLSVGIAAKRMYPEQKNVSENISGRVFSGCAGNRHVVKYGQFYAAFRLRFPPVKEELSRPKPKANHA